MKQVKRINLIILDSVGCGDAPDAAAYNDEGSNTLGNIARSVGGLNLPNLGELGLGNLTEILGVPPTTSAKGVYGRLTEVSAGKDTTTGHWELAGVPLLKPFPLYPDGFPAEVMDAFETQIGRGWLGNYPASGTEIIKTLGAKHMVTGQVIVYTSGDSVFQIAAHEEVVPLSDLYRYCQIARDLLTGDHAVGRVIARPFIGEPGSFTRTENRKDFSLEPPSDTIMDVVKAVGKDVIAIGKIEDIFAYRGITHSNHTGNNMAGISAIIETCQQDNEGLIFTNLVDFDALYGHRNNPRGYADALEAFDRRLPEISAVMRPTDITIMTADHGNDPTTPGTDHSRERVPILIFGQPVKTGINMGTRDSFADLSATIAELLGINWSGAGDSFADYLQ
ncbi:phosphopentomutase [Anaerolineales bacterium HSG6]|nr:phosphopentomutase [Anaerolineales bacterium HSG6]MDM8531137.1 phosphopentomutase [Anaerolineales bacterium HSG25]